MTYDEILESTRSARDELLKVIRGIEDQIDAIKDKEWDHPLSKADRDKLAELRARKSQVMHAVEELGYVTMGALDRTDEVRRMANAIAGVRRDLAAERERFAKIAEGITDFNDILMNLKKVADKLAEKLKAG